MRSVKLCLRVCFPWALQEKMCSKKLRPKDGRIPRVFHPTLEQVHWECVQLHRNLRNWPWSSKDRPEEPEPTLEDVRADYQDSAVDTTSDEFVGKRVRLPMIRGRFPVYSLFIRL
jgi:hypothetical protein